MISIAYKRYGTWIHHRYTFAPRWGKESGKLCTKNVENFTGKTTPPLRKNPPLIPE
jgi:hypothetical protein